MAARRLLTLSLSGLALAALSSGGAVGGLGAALSRALLAAAGTIRRRTAVIGRAFTASGLVSARALRLVLSLLSLRAGGG